MTPTKEVKTPKVTKEVKTTIFKKLLHFQESQITVSKNATNPFFKSKYATLENIIESITPKLSELGLLITHTLDNGNIITRIYDTDTDKNIESTFPVFGTKPQEIGSSISYARRYNISTLLNLSIDDDDGNKANNSKKITGEKCEKCSKDMVLGKDGKTYYCVSCWKLEKVQSGKQKIWDSK